MRISNQMNFELKTLYNLIWLASYSYISMMSEIVNCLLTKSTAI